jgi:hypothetical protein
MFFCRKDRSLAGKSDVQKRLQLLERIHETWIKGVLEPSLADAPSLFLDLHLWRSGDNQLRHEPSVPLTPSRGILDVYDQVQGDLLILGDAGAGKTTLLLELLQSLIQRAMRDEHTPIPVYLHLSSWTVNRLSLDKWLLEELEIRYQINQPERITASFLLLLDGLDEVKEELQEACLLAIDTYRKTYPHPSLVLCCDKDSYPHLSASLPSCNKVVIQPLSDEQIKDYLSHGSRAQGSLIPFLDTDPSLYEMARRPLFLRMLSQVEEKNQEKLVRADPTAKLRVLFEISLQQMLLSGNHISSRRVQARTHSLCWLARLAWRDRQREFALERIQPDWLPSTGLWQVLYYSLLGVVSLPIAYLFFGLATGNWLGILSLQAIAYLLVVFLIFSIRRRVPAPAGKAGNLSFLRYTWAVVGLGGVLAAMLNTFSYLAGIWYAIGIGLLVGCVWLNQLFDQRAPLRPGKPLQKTGRYAVTSTLLCFLVLNLLELLIGGRFDHFFGGPHLETAFAFTAGLALGGDSCIEQGILHLLVRWARCLPWDIDPFLRQALKRQILSQVGNAYLFQHQLWLHYLVSLGLDDPSGFAVSSITSQSRQLTRRNLC